MLTILILSHQTVHTTLSSSYCTKNNSKAKQTLDNGLPAMSTVGAGFRTLLSKSFFKIRRETQVKNCEHFSPHIMKFSTLEKNLTQ
jgi:hypothetical protein